MLEPVAGLYRHYKGNEYSVLGGARHSETQEEMVVYRAEYGERGLWVRPKGMFLETVSVDGHDVPRFRRVDAQGDQRADKNLFGGIPAEVPGEVFETLLGAGNVRIERIVSRGHCSPPGFWYDQEEHEWVVVLRGAARLRFEGRDEPLEMRAGDYMNIPAHVKHRVEWTAADEATVWLAVRYRG